MPHPRRRPPPPDPSLSLPPRSRPSPRLPPFAPQPRRRMGDRRGAEPRLPAPLFLFSLRRFRAKSERRLRAVGGELLRHTVRACAWRLAPSPQGCGARVVSKTLSAPSVWGWNALRRCALRRPRVCGAGGCHPDGGTGTRGSELSGNGCSALIAVVHAFAICLFMIPL